MSHDMYSWLPFVEVRNFSFLFKTYNYFLPEDQQDMSFPRKLTFFHILIKGAFLMVLLLFSTVGVCKAICIIMEATALSFNFIILTSRDSLLQII